MNVRGLKLNDLWIERLLFDLNYKFIKIGASLLALAKSIYYWVDLGTEGESHSATTAKRAVRTKLEFRRPICRCAIGQASCLICARSRQLTLPFCC